MLLQGPQFGNPFSYPQSAFEAHVQQSNQMMMQIAQNIEVKHRLQMEALEKLLVEKAVVVKGEPEEIKEESSSKFDDQAVLAESKSAVEPEQKIETELKL